MMHPPLFSFSQFIISIGIALCYVAFGTYIAFGPNTRARIQLAHFSRGAGTITETQRMRNIVIAILLAFCVQAALSAETAAAPYQHLLRNPVLRVVIDLQTGAVAELDDLHTADSSLVFRAGEDVLKIAAGEFRPAAFSVSAASATSVTIVSSAFQSQTDSVPLRATITYTLTGYRLSVSFLLESLGRLELSQGLDITIASSAWETLVIGNHFARETPIVFGESPAVRRRALNQVYELRNARRRLSLIFPNPYHSLATISTSGAHSFRFRWHALVALAPPQAVDPKGPPLASVLPPGVQLRRQIELIVNHADEAGEGLTSPIAYFSPFPEGFDQVIAMTFDDVPFGRWKVLRSSMNPDTLREAYLVKLLADHPTMKMGWVVLPDEIFSESELENPSYTPGKWWTAHGAHRILNLAPAEYLQWLRNIDRDSVVLGYEDRVHFGSHGYHHTPEMKFGRDFEFQSYQPAQDDSTFSAIEREFSLLGLGGGSLKWIRFPGFCFTRSAIDALIRHHYILFDYWGIYDKLPWMLFYSEYGRIWGIGTRWEGDTPSSYEEMDLILRAGRLCHTAGHPSKWFDGDSATAYEQINRIFLQAERNYPNLGYMFPDEVGYFADETYDIHSIETEIARDGFTVSFVGSAASGQTLMLEWPGDIPLPVAATVDGMDVPRVEARGQRLVLRLPALATGRHVIRLPASLDDLFNVSALPSSFALRQNYPNPFNGGTAIRYELARDARVKLAIYDVAGENIAVLVDREQPAGNYTAAWNGLNRSGRRAASGVYLYRLEAGDVTLVRKLILVR